MYLDTKNKNECSGCTACMAACPVNCIKMEYDDEGFVYPKVDEEKCIKCNKCRLVCPFKQKNNIVEDKKVYYAIHKNEEIRIASTSGGAFTGIVQTYEPDVIYGVKYDSNKQVVYDDTFEINKIDKFRKSKYVQAMLNDTFYKVKNNLLNGKKVLFVGTPCYVNGLLRFLNKEYENLITVDLVCHGVTSPKVFKKFLEFKEKKHKSNISQFIFRNKILKFGKWDYSYTTIKYENGKEDSSRFNDFSYGFSKGLFHRKSCFNCPYISLDRKSDLTIGDFWGIENEKRIKDDKKGTSIIIPNSFKGTRIINGISKYMVIDETPIDNVIKNNPHLATRPIEYNIKRDAFFKDLDTIGFEKAFKRNTNKNWKLKRFLLICFPTSIKRIVKKIIYMRSH